MRMGIKCISDGHFYFKNKTGILSVKKTLTTEQKTDVLENNIKLHKSEFVLDGCPINCDKYFKICYVIGNQEINSPYRVVIVPYLN
jgi:hypothetical protein